MTPLLFDDNQSEGGDTDSDILACIIEQRKRDARRKSYPHHYCGIGVNPDPTKIEPKPCLPKRKNACTRNPFCPQRTAELSIPRLLLIENTLKLYNHILEPRRIVNLVKLVHEINEPKPKRCSLMPKKHRRHHRKRGKKCKRSRASCERLWLEKQADESSKFVLSYIRSLPRYTPNYKQLHVAMYMLKMLKIKKRKCIKKCVKNEICKICQQLAVLVDTKWEPYKRTFSIEPVKSKGTVASEEKKHCIFNLMDFEYDSEIDDEEEEEEEAEAVPEPKKEAKEEAEPATETESAIGIVGDEGEGGEGGEGGAGGEGGEGGPGGEETDDEAFGAAGDQNLFLDAEQTGAGQGEGGEGSDDGKGSIHEGAGGEDEGEEDEGLDEKAWAIAEAIEALLEEEEEEETMGIAGEEGHPDGTSSYVSWCLYISWLDEFGKNITVYGNCLKKFRACLASEDASKHNDIILEILKNWSNYLGDVTRVDQNMVQYFKDKPITKCLKCRDCDIYDYPTDHDIPEELLNAVQTTIQWKILLEEAEKHCADLICGVEEPMESISVASIESVEILDVTDSDSSGFIIEDLNRNPN